MKIEYIVTLKVGENPHGFFDEMVATYGEDSVANVRYGNKRNTHFFLTVEESETVKVDGRVEAVEITPEQMEDVGIGHFVSQVGDFDKPADGLYDSTKVNWGLRRCIELTDPYTGNVVTDDYTYCLDGTGVDVVIQDSGIEANHPEWEDADGNSRLQQIDWYAESGIGGTMPTEHYTDYEGHGTHCAGVAAGKTYGWAKNANIYALKVDGIDGPTDPYGGIPISLVFDLITGWHNNKPIDPITGHKRPTIVNMSWGYSGFYDTCSNINYRGGDNAVTEGAGTIPYGLIPRFDGLTYQLPTRISSVDADVQQMIDAGIHVCIAAGNKWHKVDILAGTDYNNYVNTLYNSNPYLRYYHRGSSPFDDQAFMVGNINTDLWVGEESVASSSERGPAVDIYVPGTYITSSTSNTNVYVGLDGVYYDDVGYKMVCISGTSMASPQVCGLGAIVLGLSPHFTPAMLRDWIHKNSQPVLYETGLDDDYSNDKSLQGGPNRMLYNPLNSTKRGGWTRDI